MYSTRGQYITKTVDDNKSNSKNLYKFIKKMMGDEEITTYPTHTNPQELADDMGVFYGDKIKDIRNGILLQHSNTPTSPVYSNYHLNSSFNDLHPIEDDDVYNLINDINDKHHPDDPVPCQFGWSKKSLIHSYQF